MYRRILLQNFKNPIKMKVTIKDAELYANWLLTQCSCPIEEITFLVNTILESDNSHIIEEVIEITKNENK